MIAAVDSEKAIRELGPDGLSDELPVLPGSVHLC
jgi:hypothetical protein